MVELENGHFRDSEELMKVLFPIDVEVEVLSVCDVDNAMVNRHKTIIKIMLFL